MNQQNQVKEHPHDEESEETPPRIQLARGTSRNNQYANGQYQYSEDHDFVPQHSLHFQSVSRGQTIITVEAEIPYFNNGFANGGNRTIEMVNSTYGTASEAIDSVKGRFRVQERNINGQGHNASHEDGMYSSTDHHNGFSQQMQGNGGTDDVTTAIGTKQEGHGDAFEENFQLRGRSEVDSPLMLQEAYHSPIDYDRGVKLQERMSHAPPSRGNGLTLKSPDINTNESPDVATKSQQHSGHNTSHEKGQSRSSFGKMYEKRKDQTERSKQSIQSQRSLRSGKGDKHHRSLNNNDSDDNLADREDNNMIQNQLSNKNSLVQVQEEPSSSPQLDSDMQTPVEPNEDQQNDSKRNELQIKPEQRKGNILNTGTTIQVQEDQENEADESSAAYQEDQNNDDNDNNNKNDETLGEVKNYQNEQASEQQNDTANFNRVDRLQVQQDDSYFGIQKFQNQDRDSFNSTKPKGSTKRKELGNSIIEQSKMRSDISEKDDGSRDISQDSITSLQRKLKENAEKVYKEQRKDTFQIEESKENEQEPEQNGLNFSQEEGYQRFETMRDMYEKQGFGERNTVRNKRSPPMKMQLRTQVPTPLNGRSSIQLHPINPKDNLDIEESKTQDIHNEDDLGFTTMAKKSIGAIDQVKFDRVNDHYSSKQQRSIISQAQSKKPSPDTKTSVQTYVNSAHQKFQIVPQHDRNDQPETPLTGRRPFLQKQDSHSTINVNTNSLKKGRQKINEESNESGSQTGRNIIHIDESAVKDQLDQFRKKDDLRNGRRRTKHSQSEKIILLIDKKGNPATFTDRDIEVISRNKRNKYLLRLPSGKLIKANQADSQSEQSFLSRNIDIPVNSSIFFTKEKFKNTKSMAIKDTDRQPKSKQKSHFYKSEQYQYHDKQGSKNRHHSKRKSESMSNWKDKQQSQRKSRVPEECQMKGRFLIKNSTDDHQASLFLPFIFIINQNAHEDSFCRNKNCAKLHNQGNSKRGSKKKTASDPDYFRLQEQYNNEGYPIHHGSKRGSLKRKVADGYDEDEDTSSFSPESCLSDIQKSIDVYASQEERKTDQSRSAKHQSSQQNDDNVQSKAYMKSKRTQNGHHIRQNQMQDELKRRQRQQHPMINQVFNNHGMNYNILNHENLKHRFNQYNNQQYQQSQPYRPMNQYDQQYPQIQDPQMTYQPQYYPPMMQGPMGHQACFDNMSRSMMQMFCTMMQSHNQLMNTLLHQTAQRNYTSSSSDSDLNSSDDSSQDSNEESNDHSSDSEVHDNRINHDDTFKGQQQHMKSKKPQKDSSQIKQLQKQIESLQKQLNQTNERKLKQ